MSCRGKTQLSVDGHHYTCDKTTEDIQYWCCNQRRVLGYDHTIFILYQTPIHRTQCFSCTARATTNRRKQTGKPSIKLSGFHNHHLIQERRRPGEYAKLKEKYDRERKILPDNPSLKEQSSKPLLRSKKEEK